MFGPLVGSERPGVVVTVTVDAEPSELGPGETGTDDSDAGPGLGPGCEAVERDVSAPELGPDGLGPGAEESEPGVSEPGPGLGSGPGFEEVVMGPEDVGPLKLSVFSCGCSVLTGDEETAGVAGSEFEAGGIEEAIEDSENDSELSVRDNDRLTGTGIEDRETT